MEDDVDALLEQALEGPKPVLDMPIKDENIKVEESGDRKSKKRSRTRSKDRGKRSGSGSKRRRSKSRDRKKSPSRDKGDKDKDVDKERDRDRDKTRDKDRERRRHRSRSTSPRRRRSRSHERERERRRRSPERRRRSPSRSPRRRSPWRGGARSPAPRGRLPGPERRDVMPFSATRSPPPGANPTDMTPEERDERTVFILQLARDTRPRDLEEFFSAVGHVRDVRIITDSKTRRSKGIAYVEFWEREAVPLAMGLGGQKLLNAPLVIQMTCAERNRQANSTVGSAIGFGPAQTSGPLKLQVSNLHPSITTNMLSAIFEPFGRLDRCKVDDENTGRGYVVFRNADEAKKALEQLNGFDVAGRNIRVYALEEETPSIITGANAVEGRLDGQMGHNMGTNRLQLMAKLAEGNGVSVPQATRDAIASQEQAAHSDIPEFATQCFMLSNMFDPHAETEPHWDTEVREDVIEECNMNGGVIHIFVDKRSESGNVYVKCPTILAAHRSVLTLHGRIFAGKVITANYVPASSYHELFPESRTASTPLKTRSSGR